MNKVLFVLAVVAVGVFAVKYKVPKLPCAFELKLTVKEGSKKTEAGKYTINGRYLRYKLSLDKRDDGDLYAVYRPDITKKQDGKEMIGVAATMLKVCESDYAPLDEYLKLLDGMYDTMGFKDLSEIEWSSKDSDKYDGKKCDVYTDKDSGVKLYVYDDYPYAVVVDDTAEVFEWEWEAPMDKFKLDDCKGDFGKTPSEDYIFCAASSVKVAFVALLVALVSALF